jgi:sulfate permease, SulP family
VTQIFRVTSTLKADSQERDYLVEGQLLFASADDLMAASDFKEPVKQVRIDVSRSHIWDLTGVNAVDHAVLKSPARVSRLRWLV